MEKKIDRRTKYTLNIIKETTLKLMEEKEISKITVTEICELADINRATFYKYYEDIYNLVEEIETELYTNIKNKIDLIENKETISPFVTSIIEVIYTNQHACKVLFGKYGNKEFIRKIVYLAYIKSATEWEIELKKYSSDEINYIFLFFAHGSIGIIENWISENFKETPKEISDLIIALCNKLLAK